MDPAAEPAAIAGAHLTNGKRKERALEVSCSRLVVIRIEAFHGKCGILDHEEIVQQDLCNRTRIFASVRGRFNAVATKRDSKGVC